MGITYGTSTLFQATKGIVQDGLVLNLDAGVNKSYPRNGTTWYDLAGSNSGTLTNGATFDRDNGGNIFLDGTDDRIAIPDSNGDFDIGTGDFSICLWFYFPYQHPHSYIHFFSFDNQNNFAFKAGDSAHGPRAIYFYGSSAYRSYIGDFGTWNVQMDTWQYICLTRSGSTHKAYFDGQLIGSASISPKDLSCSTAYIGYGHSSEFTIQKRGLTKFYNRELSSDEILQNYNATKRRFE
jgi:hypothetical protein